MVSAWDIIRAAVGVCAPFVVVFCVASVVCAAEWIGERTGKR
jgi:hypothetical protein